MRTIIFAAAGMVCGLGFSSAWCEASASGDTSAIPERLVEIVVTAQKRTEDLQSVPIAITVLSGETLQNSGISSITDLALVTPGLTYGSLSGRVLPHIRGIGTTAQGPGLENSVATYVDGVYFSAMPASQLALIDVQQVEVLKGPQGTLFGRNATGGLIQVTTKDPQSTFGGEANASYSNYQTSEGNVYITGPITNSLAADLTLHGLTRQQGYGRNFFGGSDVNRLSHDLAARSKWLWTPTDATTATLSFDYSEKLGDDGSIYRPVPGASSVIPALLGGKVEPPLGPYDTDTFVKPANKLKNGGVSLRLQQGVGFATLQSITAYRYSTYETRFDPLTTPIPAESFFLPEKDTQISEEVNLTSTTSERIRWVTGLYYLGANTTSQGGAINLYGPLVSPVFPLDEIAVYNKQKTSVYAGYGQADLAITSADHLTLGARYTQERHDLENANQQGFLTGGIPIGYLLGPLSDTFTNKSPTWRIALDHKFTPDVMSYVSFNSGFKSGGFNNPATIAPFKPEKLYAYETGLKLNLLDDRLRINTAAFYYNYKDMQVQFFQQSQVAYYNAKGAKLYGLDGDLQALVAPGFSVTVGVSLLKDRFNDFPNAVVYTPVPVFGRTGPSFLTTGPATDNHLPLAPSATFNLSADYRHTLAYGTGSVDVAYQRSSNYAFTPDNAFQQAPFSVLNASLAWSTPGERFTATLWGKNLTNDVVASFITETGSVMLAQYKPPRTYGVTVGAKF